MTRGRKKGVIVRYALVFALATTCGCHSAPSISSGDGAKEGLWGQMKHVAGNLPGTKFVANRFKAARSLVSSEPKVPSPKLTDQNFAAVQVALGRGMERDGDLRGAKAAYEAAVRNDSDCWEGLHRLALVKEKQGAGTSVEPLLQQALELSPRNPEILCDLGYWCALREKWPEAQRFYERAIEVKPDFPRAHNNLGLLLAHGGDIEAAMRHFSAAGLTPAEARTNMGFVHMSQQDWQSARDQLQLALKYDPGLKKATVLITTVEKVADDSAPVATTTSHGTELVTSLDRVPDVDRPLVTTPNRQSVERAAHFTP